MEVETYNFYQRMMALFPRDYKWKEKAGLFLYARLSLSFKKVPAEEYQSFYESMQQFAYPFEEADGTPDDTTDITLYMPMTGRTIVIKPTIYDPVKESLDFLQQSVKLSPSYETPTEVQEAISDINSWLSNKQEAMVGYYKLVYNHPQNVLFRNKLINLLIASSAFSEAAAQLDTLYFQKKITQPQISILANYLLIAGKYKQAADVLKAYHPSGKAEKVGLMMLYIRLNKLANQSDKMLFAYLNDSIPVLKTEKNDDWDETKFYKRKWVDFKLYTTAHIYAAQKNYDKAFEVLKAAVDSGFNLKYVLDNDKIWAQLRGTSKWNTLMAGHEFKTEYSSEPQKQDRNPIEYRIPTFKSLD